MRMFTLAEVAARTDDRTLLLETVSEARDAYSNGSPAVRRGAAGVLGLAAWQRDDVHEAVRWLGGDISLLVTPLLPDVLDLLTLTARVASAAGDAGLRARVLDAVDVLERERPGVPLFAAVAQHARGILERDADALVAVAERASLVVAAASLRKRCRGRRRRAESRTDATPRRSTSSMRHSTPTSSAKRSPMPAGSAARCAD